nr:hypothetical protein L204_02251 [Cryptococcus depauperatus CBS 7855]
MAPSIRGKTSVEEESENSQEALLTSLIKLMVAREERKESVKKPDVNTFTGDADLDKDRRRAAIEVANASIQSDDLEEWIVDVGKPMAKKALPLQTWINAFKKDNLPSGWEISERRKWAKLSMRRTSDWAEFDAKCRYHRRNMEGTACYPDERYTVYHYVTGLSDELYQIVEGSPLLSTGTLKEVRKYIGDQTSHLMKKEESSRGHHVEGLHLQL